MSETFIESTAGYRPPQPSRPTLAVSDRHDVATADAVHSLASVVAIVPADDQRSAEADRLRIAVGVNDTVIRHLFSISLDLHTTRALSSTMVQSRLDSTIHELDTAISELRSLIFDLEGDR